MVRTLNPEKRTNLLNAALKLFVLNGVKNTSTAEIAREAGIAAGTLFLYFPTKQALLDELVLNLGREQSESIQPCWRLHSPLGTPSTPSGLARCIGSWRICLPTAISSRCTIPA